MGLLGKALAGGMAGAGEGLSSVGEKRYNSAMEEVKALRDANLARLQADYVFDQRKELAQTERGWHQEDSKAAFEQQKALAKQKGEYDIAEKKLDMGKIKETFRGEDGTMYGVTQSGETVNLGVKGEAKGSKGKSSQGRLDKSDYDVLNNIFAQHLVGYLPEEAKANIPPDKAPSFEVIMQYLPDDIRNKALAAYQDAEYLVSDSNRGYGNAVSVALKNRMGQTAQPAPSPAQVPAREQIVAELRSVAPEDMPRKAAQINNRYQSLEVQRILEQELEKIREAPPAQKGKAEQPKGDPRKSDAYRKWADNPPVPQREEASFNIFGGLLGENPEYQRRVEEAKRRSEENKKRLNIQ